MRGRCLLLPVSTGLPHKQHGPLWLQAGARHDPNIRMKMMIPGFRHGEYRPHNVRRAHLPPDRCRLNLRSDIGAESGGIANPCRQFLVIHQYSLLGKVSGNVLRTTWTARRTSGGRYSPWRNPGSSFSCGYWDRGWLQIEAVGAMLLMGKPC